MNWQDLVFSIGNVCFLVANMGAILSPTQKPPRLSCTITAICLWAFVLTYASLDLWFSFCVGTLSASGWTLLVFQKRMDAIEYLDEVHKKGGSPSKNPLTLKDLQVAVKQMKKSRRRSCL